MGAVGPPQLISIDEARERVLAEVSPLPAETLAVTAALGRVLAEDVAAPADLPPFASSAMDGFALVAGPGAELPIVGESRAGSPAARALEPGQAMRISTGAQLPEGATAVVPIERVELVDGRVRVPDTSEGANIRLAGEDMRAGEVLIAAGTTLGPAELAVLSSIGRAQIRCGQRPRVAVLATGDELVPAGEPLAPGQIHDSNSVALTAQAEQAGAVVVKREVVRDEREATVTALRDALEEANVVCVSGGVSVGEHDHVKNALDELGVEGRFWGVKLKPGKPTWFGRSEAGLVFGLPGNPVSAMVTFHVFALPALRRLGGSDPEGVRASAVADAPLPRARGRESVIRCRLRTAEDGWHVEPTKEQESHVLSSMLGAGAYAFVPEGEGDLPVGSRVQVELLPAR
jgi:molybdopterin molybdotransferase